MCRGKCLVVGLAAHAAAAPALAGTRAAAPPLNYVLAGCAAVGLLGLLGASLVRTRRRRAALAPPSAVAQPTVRARADDAGARAGATVRRMCAAFNAWLADPPEQPDLWTAFDQLLRELLGEHLGATRVRCYHARAGCDVLQALAQAGKAAAAAGPSAREGLLGHVVTSGREYAEGDTSLGPLVAALAARGDDGWSWVWPVRDRRGTVGIVALGNLREPATLSPAMRQAVGELITLVWRAVSALEHLQIVAHTDQGSGVLTRNDFFSRAADALRDSYAEGEPVVVAAFAAEGLRGLDDTGRWRERDVLIERLGRLLARRARSDDLVGRFADDRFVVLLRRLDSALGRLIAGKIHAAGQELLHELPAVVEHVRLRVGVAGSGLARPPLERLLVSAFEALERARRTNVDLSADLETRRELRSESEAPNSHEARPPVAEAAPEAGARPDGEGRA
ncbi:MAG: GGDEF domain-containing protein [Planctomycetota bacterium]